MSILSIFKFWGPPAIENSSPKVEVYVDGRPLAEHLQKKELGAYRPSEQELTVSKIFQQKNPLELQSLISRMPKGAVLYDRSMLDISFQELLSASFMLKTSPSMETIPDNHPQIKKIEDLIESLRKQKVHYIETYVTPADLPILSQHLEQTLITNRSTVVKFLLENPQEVKEMNKLAAVVFDSPPTAELSVPYEIKVGDCYGKAPQVAPFKSLSKQCQQLKSHGTTVITYPQKEEAEYQPLDTFLKKGVLAVGSSKGQCNQNHAFSRAGIEMKISYLNLKRLARNSLEASHLQGESIFEKNDTSCFKPLFQDINQHSFKMNEEIETYMQNSEKAALQVRLELSFIIYEQKILKEQLA